MQFRSLSLSLFLSLLLPAEASLLGKILGFPFEDEQDNLDVNRYIVTFKNREGRRAGIRSAFNFLLDLDKINAIAVTLPKGRAEKLRSNPNIESVDEDEIVTLSSIVEQHSSKRHVRREAATENSNINIDDRKRRRKLRQTLPYGISMVQADQVPFDGGDMKVCIIDTGYTLGHEDLPKDNVDGFEARRISQLFTSLGLGSILGRGFGVLGQWDKEIQPLTHGTHVAGTIAALDNDIGVVGVAPGVNLYIVNVFPDPSGNAYISSIIRAVGLCQDSGAKVINMSLGGLSLNARNRGPTYRAMNEAYESGMLLFAAAGNNNSTLYGVPASYEPVISIGAIDEDERVADFSNKNDRVELAAPGVAVLSTVGKDAILSTLELNITSNDPSEISCIGMLGSSEGEGVGQLEYCGLGDGQTPCDPTGKICLIERGGSSFAEKVKFCEDKGSIATIIYNNAPGQFAGTLSEYQSIAPAVSITNEDGAILRNYTGEARVAIEDSVYTYLSGTSMASPHAAGVAALVWSKHPSCSNVQIRDVLQKTAKDLGFPGKDNSYGYGLIQAKAAVDYLDVNGCS